YLRVAAILVVLTVLEVGVFYVPAFHPVLVPTLLVLSACKFALVVLFYMHLKMDSRFFAFLFGAPLGQAAVVMMALLFLFCGAPTWCSTCCSRLRSRRCSCTGPRPG